MLFLSRCCTRDLIRLADGQVWRAPHVLACGRREWLHAVLAALQLLVLGYVNGCSALHAPGVLRDRARGASTLALCYT